MVATCNNYFRLSACGGDSTFSLSSFGPKLAFKIKFLMYIDLYINRAILESVCCCPDVDQICMTGKIGSISPC